MFENAAFVVFGDLRVKVCIHKKQVLKNQHFSGFRPGPTQTRMSSIEDPLQK